MKLHIRLLRTLMATSPFVILTACSTWAEPPQHLTMNQDVKVKFQSSKEASESCSDIHKAIKGKKNGNIKACAYRKTAEAEPIVIIPNPCEFDDVYATLLCHELGHINQMVFGQSVDHAGWGDSPVKLASAKTETFKKPQAKETIVVKEAEISKVTSTPKEAEAPKEATASIDEKPKAETNSPKLRGLSKVGYNKKSKLTGSTVALRPAS